MSALTEWETGLRVTLDFIFLILANCGLISLHQMAGQFGVIGNSPDVLTDDDENADNQNSTLTPLSYSPPELQMSRLRCNSPCNDNSKHNSGKTNMVLLDIEDTPLGVVTEEYQKKPVHGPPLLMHLLLNVGGIHPDNQVFARWRPLKRKVRASMSEKHKRQLKIFLTFVFVTIFWSVIWDLFGSLPKEELVTDDDENGKTVRLRMCGVLSRLHICWIKLTCRLVFVAVDDEDDYDRHNTGGDSDPYILIVGICYVVVAFFYLALSGELFAFVATEDEEPDNTVESTNNNVSSMLSEYILLDSIIAR